MWNALKSMLTVPSATTLAQRELEEAKRQLLKAQSAADLSRVQVVYHEDRIRRLKKYIKDANQEEAQS